MGEIKQKWFFCEKCAVLYFAVQSLTVRRIPLHSNVKKELRLRDASDKLFVRPKKVANFSSSFYKGLMGLSVENVKARTTNLKLST